MNFIYRVFVADPSQTAIVHAYIYYIKFCLDKIFVGDKE